MKRHLLLALTMLCLIPSFAQEADVTEKEKSNNSFLSHLSIGLRASTMGVGIQAATPINDYLKLRAGIDYFGFKTNSFDIGLDDPDGIFDQAFGYTPDYTMKGEVNFTNGNLLVDFHPTKGIFHITAGVYIGTNKLKAKGFLADQNGNPAALRPEITEWPNIDFDGHKLTLNDANLNAELQLGKVIKPYFGIGIGRAIANKRLAFKFELGAIYQGNYSIKQNGKSVNFEKGVTENFEDIDTYTGLLKWWPMMNFQLSYKIF